MDFKDAKMIVFSYAKDNSWLGTSYNMNTYNSCCHVFVVTVRVIAIG